MRIIEFTITVTPPLANTADGGQSVLDKSPYLKEPGRIFPKSQEDKERAARLGVSFDIGIFIFAASEAMLSSVCEETAMRILSERNPGNMKILVEGSKADAVISLLNLNVQELAKQLYAIAIQM